jgi:hypothetical protein|nr:MAG TPA: hypothetical protein [Caudoviricetes sp.]
MYTQLSFNDLLLAIKKRIEDGTGKMCYDAVPKDAASPFYFAEIIQSRPADTKTMYRMIYQVWLHSIAEPGASSVQVNDLIKGMEEAMTDEIVLPDGYELIMQTNMGVQTIKTDETNEKHAVSLYQFTVCYGFKCK